MKDSIAPVAVLLLGCILNGCTGGAGALPPTGTTGGSGSGAVPTPAPTQPPSSGSSAETLAVAGVDLPFYPVGAAQPSTVYAPPTTPGQAPPTFGAVGMAVDGSGNLYVAERPPQDAVVGFPPPFTGNPVTIASYGGVNLVSIAVTPSGSVFVAPVNIFGTAGIQIDMYEPPSLTKVQLPVPLGVHFAPQCLALDAKGDLFSSNDEQYNGDPGMLEWTPPYTGTPLEFPFGGVEGGTYSQGANCAVDQNSGDLFVDDPTRIAVYAPPYTGTPVTITENTAGIEPIAISSANDDLFVANGNTVDVYPPPYTALGTSVSTAVNQPNLVATDAAGNLFVGSTYNAGIAEYAPPYTAAPIWTVSAFAIGGSNYLQIIP